MTPQQAAHADPTRPVDHQAFARHVDAVAATIDRDFGGDFEAYFAQHPKTGYALTAAGWALRTEPAPTPGDTSELEFAVTDYRVFRHRAHYSGPVCEHGADCEGPQCNDYPITADGIWVDEYDSCDEPRIETQIGTNVFSRCAPGPDAAPVLVLGDFQYGQQVFWPEAVWFDKNRATRVLTTRLACDHQVDYADEGAKQRVETEIWYAAEGFWVGRLINPAELNADQWGDGEEVWCVLDEHYVAHLIHCHHSRFGTRLSAEAKRLQLVQIATFIASVAHRLSHYSEADQNLMNEVGSALILPDYQHWTDISMCAGGGEPLENAAVTALLDRFPHLRT